MCKSFKYYIKHEVLKQSKWNDLGYIYKRRLAIELFKVIHNRENRLSQYFKIKDSGRKGTLLEVPRMNTNFGRNSLIFRGPIVWNNLDKKTRDVDKIELFKTALKKIHKAMKQTSFIKGTCTNNNKDLVGCLYITLVF
jgi:hypothetical protein